MTTIQWDQVGQRGYETGVDRGVLYPVLGGGVAWNGLTSVSEKRTDATVTPHYLDGVKYLNTAEGSDYSAVLTAFTYPDEFLPCDGIADLGSGLLVDGQVPQPFGLSYRTRVGNDVDTELGYKIHLLYNLTAVPTDKNYVSLTAQAAPSTFSWDISGIPVSSAGFRPSSHFIVDSTKSSAYALAAFESLLYGEGEVAPALPFPDDILTTLQTEVQVDIITELFLEPI